MRKIVIFVLAGVMQAGLLHAGGIVTNTNQSAAWVRWLVRDASLGIDAAYYNPAGLMKLDDGFHLSLNNQFIFQTQTIVSDYPYLRPTPKEYEAKVTALLFPDLFAVYKKGKFAFSAGVVPIGGGGSADFSDGIASFEIPVSELDTILSYTLAGVDQYLQGETGRDPGFRNINGYSLKAALNGSSVYLGYQATVSYAINDLIQVSLGARYVSVHNSYEGHLTDVHIGAPEIYGGEQRPGTYMRLVADSVQPHNPYLAGKLRSGADKLDAATADGYVDVTQKGGGVTAIIGVNISPSEDLNIALKYEHHTKIEVENNTRVDSFGLFPDGAKSRADLPGMLSAGIQYRPVERLTLQAGFHYYFDKPAYYGKTVVDTVDPGTHPPTVVVRQVDNRNFMKGNTWELGLGAEYMVTDKFGVSVGFLHVTSGANERYQSAIGFSLSTNTIGGGFVVNFTDKMQLNMGFDYVMYKEESVAASKTVVLDANRFNPKTFDVNYSTTYDKQTIVFGVGLDISF